MSDASRPTPSAAPAAESPPAVAQEEVAATLAGSADPETAAPTGPYRDARDCARFAAGFADQELGRALTLFEQLAVSGEARIEELAETLSVPIPALWGSVSNPVKRRADAIGLPMPYDSVRNFGEVLIDSWGVAPNIAGALRDEMRSRIVAREEAAEKRPPPARPPEPVAAGPADRAAERYAALTDRLGLLERGERRFTLDQIESVLGFELPAKAWMEPEWWANDAGLAYLRHANAWLSAGWNVEPDLDTKSVIFRPIPEPGEQPAPSEAPPPPEQRRRRFATLGRLRWLARPFSRSRDVGPQGYTEAVCREFADGLGDTVLARAQLLFEIFEEHGTVESEELAQLLDTETKRLGGQLATPLRRRANQLAVDPPYEIVVTDEGARIWHPAGGAEAHLGHALSAAHSERGA